MGEVLEGDYEDAPAHCPGIMRWAVVVPAFMSHTPPPRPFSGSPSDAPVAPGTAIVMWCGEMGSLSAPEKWYQTDPNSRSARGPSASLPLVLASSFAPSPRA